LKSIFKNWKIENKLSEDLCNDDEFEKYMNVKFGPRNKLDDMCSNYGWFGIKLKVQRNPLTDLW
jgi:hypothetical protein